MTDQELLELAAKAEGCGNEMFLPGSRTVEMGYEEWNPLVNDGDALRLAVKLHLDIEHLHEAARPACVVVGCFLKGRLDCVAEEDYGANPNAAVRRAIVRAAAMLAA
jgi:hypothetical protein